MNMKGKDAARSPLYAEPSRLMTVRDLSEYLHVHISTIYRMLKQHEIPAFRIGSDWRFNIESVHRWCSEQANTSSSSMIFECTVMLNRTRNAG